MWVILCKQLKVDEGAAMARHPIPQVINDQLTSLDAAGSPLLAIQVGSADWHDWLNNPATCSFAYDCANGILTARSEQRRVSRI
jgi:hypothetical protein